MNGSRIFVVEDDGVSALRIKGMLTRLGYEASGAASTGEEAVERAGALRPDLVLMDIQLAGKMDGIEAAGIIRERFGIPSLYITAFVEDTLIDKSKITEPYAYLVKPFQEWELKANIEISLYRHQMERQLKEKEYWLRITLRSIGDGVITTDTQGNVTLINPVAEQLTGWSQGAAAGKPIVEIFNIVNEHTGLAEENPVNQILQQGAAASLASHTVLAARDGTRRGIADSGAPIRDEQGNIIGAVLVFRDVTDIRQMESALREKEIRYRNLFENMKDGVAIYRAVDNGQDFIFVDFNRAGERIENVSREELIGKSLVEKFPGVKEFGLFEVLQRVWKTGNPEHHPIGLYKDGRIGGWRDNYVSRLPGGEIVAIYSDETARKQGELEAEKLQAQLRQAQKMEAIGTLAGGIAHDFNNILFPITGYTEMAIADLPQTSRLRANLEEVLRASHRARDLVRQILAFSRQGESEFKPFRVQFVVKEALVLLRASLPSTIEIRQRINRDCGPILGDPTQIHQVMMNLCGNASHAMTGRNGTLEVALDQVYLNPDEIGEPEMPPGTYVKLSVSDTGHGIPHDILGKIYEPYFTTKEVGRGTGLGLSVVHGIVKNHRGRITVYSEVNKGTAFHIYLPVIPGFKDAVQSASAADEVPEGRERILLVDDDAHILKMITQMLSKLGYQVVSRTNGLEALAAFMANPDQFDLVITDATMPQMTGMKLSHEILNIRPGIPIILCTGFSETITHEQASEMGIKGFLMKPVLRSELAKVMRKVLAGR
jgi:PAS domain S-box-containing protein